MHTVYVQQTVIDVYALSNSDDIPAMAELIALNGKIRIINIPREIGVQYHIVGTVLLNDGTGIIMDLLDKTLRGDIERINVEILRSEGCVKLKHYNCMSQDHTQVI